MAALFGAYFVTSATASVNGGADTGPVVGATSTPNGTAGWTVTANGTVHVTGAAHFYGDLAGRGLAAPVVGIAALPAGNGYWLLAGDGGVFTFGAAHFYGSTGGIHLNQPVVGMAPTRTGHGYWLVARDGGIFSFGDAHFYGSTGAIHLNQPIVGMSAQPSVNGYWLVAADGGVFPFGNARFAGSTGALQLAQPVRAMAATRTGHGYWLVAADGGIFAFGDAQFYGSTAGSCVGVVGIIPTTTGYIIAGADGSLRQMTPQTQNAQAPSSCASSACPSSFVQQVAQLTNAARAQAGLPALALQSQLEWAAEQRSSTQAATNTMSHDGWTTVIAQSGYSASNIGENVAAGYDSPTAVVTGWLNSPPHRANILDPHYRDLGVGCAYNRGHVAYWTQDFGGSA